MSKREARDLITQGSISVNGQKVTSIEALVKQEEAYFKKYSVLKKGKKNYFTVVHTH